MSPRRSRAERFLTAFKDIEDHLRDFLAASPQVGFETLVTQATPRRPAVRRYQQRLRQFGWLRNAIVHSRDRKPKPIADPREDVVREIQAIRNAIVDPPLLSRVLNASVMVGQSDDSLLDAARLGMTT
jgi:hypothetical protein